MRAGCSEGKAEKAERPAAVAMVVAGVRVFIVPKDGERKPWHKRRKTEVREPGSKPRLPLALPVRKVRKAKPRRGKGGRKVET